MKYRVFIYATVHFPVEVEAADEEAATLAALDAVDVHHFNFGHADFSDDITGYLVDRLDEKGEVVDDGTDSVYLSEYPENDAGHELLVALRELYEWADNNVPYGVPVEIAERINTAIKKAEGGR